MATTTKSLEELEQDGDRRSRRPADAARAKIIYSLLGALGFIGIWSFFAAFVFEPYVLPSPGRVAIRMWELHVSGHVFTNFACELPEDDVGLGAGARHRDPDRAVDGSLPVREGVPPRLRLHLRERAADRVRGRSRWSIFGISPLGPAFVVMLEVFTGIAINIAAGVESVDRGLLAMSRSFRRKSGQTARSIVFPSVVPFLFASGRVSFANSWKLAALAETFGGRVGVGFQLEKAFQTFSVEACSRGCSTS